MANLPDLFRSNRSLFSDLFQELDGFFSPGFNRALPLGDEFLIQASSDIEETDKEYLLTFDMPGVAREDIKVDLNQNVLTVTGERGQKMSEGKTGVRKYGKFQRSIVLPQGVTAEDIQAHYDNGVLEVVIPKPQETVVRSIQIQEGRAASQRIEGQKVTAGETPEASQSGKGAAKKVTKDERVSH